MDDGNLWGNGGAGDEDDGARLTSLLGWTLDDAGDGRGELGTKKQEDPGKEEKWFSWMGVGGEVVEGRSEGEKRNGDGEFDGEDGGGVK